MLYNSTITTDEHITVNEEKKKREGDEVYTWLLPFKQDLVPALH